MNLRDLQQRCTTSTLPPGYFWSGVICDDISDADELITHALGQRIKPLRVERLSSRRLLVQFAVPFNLHGPTSE
jgi:hypothetical protein